MKHLLLIWAVFIPIWAMFGCSPKSYQSYTPAEKGKELPEDAIENLSDAVQIPTISYEKEAPEDFDTLKFREFHRLLEERYPLIHENMELEIVNEMSMLYKWEGKNDDKKPVLFLAHHDVVPIEAPDRWTHPPFSGKIAESYIWGRGTLDDKGSIIAAFEAAEKLLEQDFEPDRSVYFAFGHDEEIGGRKGALEMANILKERGVDFEYSLDEGGMVSEGLVPGMDKPVALIGTANKGYLSLQLTVQGTGGHSSMPPKENSVSILAGALKKLEANPFPARLSAPVHDFLDHIGPEQSFFNRLAMTNRWLFSGVIKRQYSKTATGDATVRTTMAPTMLNAGIKDNVIPAEAKAVVNLRLLPGTSKADAIERIRKILDDDRISISQYGNYSPPTPVSSYDSEGFRNLRDLTNAHFDSVAVAPYLVIAGTDSRHYTEVARDNYRFLPIVLDSEGLDRIHGIDEKISFENFRTMYSFYYHWLREP